MNKTKNLIIFTLLFAVIAVFSTSSFAAGNDVYVHFAIYERAQPKAPVVDVSAIDANPAFKPGNQLTVADFKAALGSDARTQFIASGAMRGTKDGSPVFYENKQVLPFVNAQRQLDEAWFGKMVSGYVSANDNFAFLRLKYEERIPNKPVKNVKDWVKSEGNIRNEIESRGVTLALNTVMIWGSYTAKSGNQAYIAVCVSDSPQN